MTLEFKRTFYTADTLSLGVLQKLFDKLNEQVVIRKKTTPVIYTKPCVATRSGNNISLLQVITTKAASRY
ncbi:MAG: hypothetical protein IPL54_08515 [Chitinophagaceae bacterium]|nr:hypothetical protein [Chitinophagaceae bacterium]